MAATDTQVAVIGGGVVGCAVAHALARRGVQATLLESEHGLALGASGANSGILHTGFDSTPGALETRLIVRSSALREELQQELGVSIWRCGARLTPVGEQQRAAVARLAANARVNGVEAHLEQDGSLSVPAEAVTDPAAFVHALARAAQADGAILRLDARVCGLTASADASLTLALATGERLRARAVVNCAGLYADEVARMAGEELVSVYPRKGEFLVFSAPSEDPLERILLPVPAALGKGVLVFPTLDRRAVIAGPTAREREDKRDWSVEADAAELILARARQMYPALERLEPIGAYAGLRPAGRDANYVIERSRTLPGLIHAAAIRSTGLSAALAIAEHVLAMLDAPGETVLARRRRPSPRSPSPPACAPPSPPGAWWERAVLRSRGRAASPGAR
jgi:glycerol-3-phosphate dehydrogenase